MTGARVALWAALVLLAQLVDVLAVDRLPAAGPAVDVLLLVVAWGGLVTGSLYGALLGICAGLLADLTPPAAGLLGVNALAYGVAGAVAGRWYRPGGSTANRPLPLSLLAVAAAAVLMTAMHLLFGITRLGWQQAAVACGAAAGLAVVVGVVVLPVLDALDRRVVDEAP